MAMVDAKVNYNFEESEVDINQVKVTNNLGRTISHLELVALDGYFGEVVEFDDIADGATGLLNIDSNRKISTTQINITDTFVVNGIVWLVSQGTLATDVLRDAYVADAVPVGRCTKVNNGTSVEFMPFAQRTGGVNDIKASVYEIDSDASSAIVLTGLVPLGAKIVDVMVECKAAKTSGVVTLKSNAGTPLAITSAMICAVDNALARTTLLTNDIVDANGLQIIAGSATERGIVTILWR